jgi:hypothetical protein
MITIREFTNQIEAALIQSLLKDNEIDSILAGLLHALLEMSDRQALWGHPKFDANREGFALEQVLASLPAVDAWFLGRF